MVVAKKRHPRHDDLIATILSKREVLQYYAQSLAGIRGDLDVVTEYECRGVENNRSVRLGWVDIRVVGFAVCSQCKKSFERPACFYCGEVGDHYDRQKDPGGYKLFCPDRRSALEEQRAMIVEVKSELEKWTAGDVVRQLKRYGQSPNSISVCGVPPVLAFFCDRPLSESEQTIFTHEGVHILR